MPEDSDSKKPSKDAEEEPQGPTKKFPGWLKWTAIFLGISISTLGAFSLTRYILLPKYQKYRMEKQSSQRRDNNKRQKMGMIHTLEEVTVNPSGSKGRRFVLAEFAIEVSNKKILEELQSRGPQVRDEFINYLRRKTADQILELSFQEQSKSELIEIVNQRLISGAIDSLYYIKLIVQ